MKSFVDLRLAFECVLKAWIAFRQPYSCGGKALVDRVQNYKHSLHRLFTVACKLWKIAEPIELKQLVIDCNQLEVGLRYALDAYHFREADDALYYRTIGSDQWMRKLQESIEDLWKRINAMLIKRSKVVTIDGIIDDYLESEHYNKYSKS